MQDAAVVADHRDHVKSVRRPNRSTNSNVRARGVSMVCTVFVASVYYVTHFSVKFVAWHMIGGLLNSTEAGDCMHSGERISSYKILINFVFVYFT